MSNLKKGVLVIAFAAVATIAFAAKCSGCSCYKNGNGDYICRCEKCTPVD